MAELIWTEPALSDLDTIADYIALDNQRQHAILSGEYLVMWNSWPSTRRAAHGPKSCALRGIGRSLSRPVAFSIATMESEPLFCTSCAGRCACAGVSSSRETDGTGRPNRIKNSREFRVGGPPPSGRHSPVFALVPQTNLPSFPPNSIDQEATAGQESCARIRSRQRLLVVPNFLAPFAPLRESLRFGCGFAALGPSCCLVRLA